MTRKTITTTHARYTAHESTSDKLVKLMEAPYETTLSVVDPKTGEGQGNNLLVTNYDRYCESGDELIAVVRIYERYNYVQETGGYYERVAVEGDRERLRAGVRRALDYARAHNLWVQVNNRHVWEDIEAGLIDASGLEVRYSGWGAARASSPVEGERQG